MRILFDSHALVWFLAGDPRFSPRARAEAEANDGVVYVSAVTVWEVTNKVRRGKWSEAAALAESFPETISKYGFEPLPISLEHARVAGFLASLHRDPFDRMLAAQAQVEGIPLVTADPVFRGLGVRVLW
jgi:PIN domain nuclease of toxin-antitoxin system